MTERVLAEVSFIGPSFSAGPRDGRTGSARSRPSGLSSRSGGQARRAARYNVSGVLHGGRVPARPLSERRDALTRPVARPRTELSGLPPSALLGGRAARRSPDESDRPTI